MSIFDFFRKRKVTQTVKELNSDNPYQNIQNLLEILDTELIEKYTIRKSLGHRVYTYSDNVEMLIQWVNWLHSTVDTNGYADEKWKSVNTSFTGKNLDDYMSSEARDVDPGVFLTLCRRKLKLVCDRMLAQAAKNSEQEVRIRYYRRIFKPIAEDVQTVLKELYLVVNK